MAREKKNTHIIANSWLDYWKALADAGMTEESNELMVAMNYMFMGLDYEIKNPAVRLAFEIFIKSQYEQNEKHYQESCDAKSEAALKREANKRAKKADKTQKPQSTTKSTTVMIMIMIMIVIMIMTLSLMRVRARKFQTRFQTSRNLVLS